jgi:hypothetical protein
MTSADLAINHRLPTILEFVGHGTGLGKSLLATTAELVYRDLGYEVTMVRIESRLIEHRGAHIAIATENFSRAAALVGGISAVAEPLFSAIKAIEPGNEALIIDWAGGQANHRAEIYVATRFSERLRKRGLSAASVVVTTNATADMAHAATLLTSSAQVAPSVDRYLALNRRRGPFSFLKNSEQAKVYARLKDEADGRAFDVRAVGGESWKICDEAGLAMPDVISADVDALAERLKCDDFIAAAIQAEVAAWYSTTEAELLRVLSTSDAAAN